MSVDRGGGGDDADAKTGVEHSPILFLAAFSLMAYQPPALRGTLYSVVPTLHTSRFVFNVGAHVFTVSC